MSSRGQIKRFALRALLRMGGVPMPEPALRDSISLACGQTLQSEIDLALRELETDQLITGNKDDVIEVTTWTLTDRGEHKAKQLA